MFFNTAQFIGLGVSFTGYEYPVLAQIGLISLNAAWGLRCATQMLGKLTLFVM
jgi:hypothetical protein